ncbi:MAG: aminopeptidase [Treponema sp.]|nr:aminopeptidase [Treponema sp.]
MPRRSKPGDTSTEKNPGKAAKRTDPKNKDQSPGQQLADKLCFTLKNCWEGVDEKTEKEIDALAASYREMLNRGKTEREFSAAAVELLKKNGFKPLSSFPPSKAAGLSPGSKIYEHIRGKALVAAVVGKRPVAEGINILGAHVDSPRIDLKQNPLYEENDFALLDTHYYGGIKKYQWTAIPLAMHGVFIDSNGKEVSLSLGEADDDPVFTITDLLPHLAQDQMQKKAAEVVEGEDLDVLAGSRPYVDEKVKEKVKLRILSVLNEQYGITEQSFAAAEIEFVPAFKARDLGFDRSMIGAYGHDDRCCAYPALKALVEIAASKDMPAKTALCYLSDKEEIGSYGNTGAQSWGFENFIAALAGEENLRRCLANSSMLSADVAAAVDPSYASVFDKRNSAYMGKGLVLTKYTGSRGKYGASDANAEFCARVQALMNRNKVPWQFGELGKVDKGGGGTIALHAAKYGIEVLDCGVPVLSMHSPFEVISKVDLYTTYRGYLAFLREM